MSYKILKYFKTVELKTWKHGLKQVKENNDNASFFITTVVGIQAYSLQRPSSRIVNGAVAASGEFPHQITFLVDTYHLCGGSIIANGWAITAAHCTYGQ